MNCQTDLLKYRIPKLCILTLSMLTLCMVAYVADWRLYIKRTIAFFSTNLYLQQLVIFDA